jgi:hypothetical protein
MLCRNLPPLIGQLCFGGASNHRAAGRPHPTSSTLYYKVPYTQRQQALCTVEALNQEMIGKIAAYQPRNYLRNI